MKKDNLTDPLIGNEDEFMDEYDLIDIDEKIKDKEKVDETETKTETDKEKIEGYIKYKDGKIVYEDKQGEEDSKSLVKKEIKNIQENIKKEGLIVFINKNKKSILIALFVITLFITVQTGRKIKLNNIQKEGQKNSIFKQGDEEEKRKDIIVIDKELEEKPSLTEDNIKHGSLDISLDEISNDVIFMYEDEKRILRDYFNNLTNIRAVQYIFERNNRERRVLYEKIKPIQGKKVELIRELLIKDTAKADEIIRLFDSVPDKEAIEEIYRKHI